MLDSLKRKTSSTIHIVVQFHAACYPYPPPYKSKIDYDTSNEKHNNRLLLFNFPLVVVRLIKCSIFRIDLDVMNSRIIVKVNTKEELIIVDINKCKKTKSERIPDVLYTSS